MRLTPLQLLLANLEGRARGRARIEKAEALSALQKMSGMDFGYDAKAWRVWFETQKRDRMQHASRGAHPPSSWISQRTSSEASVRRRYGQRPNVASFLDALRPGDVLRAFRSPDGTFQKRVGRRGYVLIRDGKVIAHVMTAMS